MNLKSRIPHGLAVAVLTLAVYPFGSPLADEKTTVIETTTTTQPVPSKGQVSPSTSNANNKKKSGGPTQQVTTTTATTVEKTAPRKMYDEKMLKDIANTLCTEGYKAYVGNENKNVCQGKAKAPDIAYSCVWKDDSPQAFPKSEAGPCNLDFTEHAGNYVVTREFYKSGPPLPYGTEVQCCYRPASEQSAVNLHQ